MPFDITCTSCSRLLRVPDDGAGKHVQCPQCQTVLLAPQPNGKPHDEAKSGTLSTVEMWHMKGADGQTYGPVPRSELDTWCREGRLAATTQILLEGGQQWQWATDIYPHLSQTAPVGSSGYGPAAGAIGGGSQFYGGSPNPGYAAYNPYTPGGYSAYQDPRNLSDKSRVAAGLLGIFVGAYGVHRFYLGDVGTGFLQIAVTICTCGIGGLWGFIEGIMILSGSIDRDSYGRKLRD